MTEFIRVFDKTTVWCYDETRVLMVVAMAGWLTFLKVENGHV
jgi:hypothetical protein